jgi:hypothetical protein
MRQTILILLAAAAAATAVAAQVRCPNDCEVGGSGGGGSSGGGQTNTSLGESCASLPCYDFDWCNPATKMCEEKPGEGQPCLSAPTGNGLACRDLGGLFCDKSGGSVGVCRNQTSQGQVCNLALGSYSCFEQTTCVVGADGSGRCLQALPIGYFCDKPEDTCWRKGFKATFSQAPDWTQDLRCEASVCAEDRGGG